jgi:hypothetical protein
MRAGRNLSLAVALLVGTAACDLLAEPAFTVECREPDVGIRIGAPLPVAECQEVLDAVVSRFGWEHPRLGEMILIAVEVLDCPEAARDIGRPELAFPGVDGCWRVRRDFEAGGTTLFATRSAETGTITFYE